MPEIKLIENPSPLDLYPSTFKNMYPAKEYRFYVMCGDRAVRTTKGNIMSAARSCSIINCTAYALAGFIHVNKIIS